MGPDRHGCHAAWRRPAGPAQEGAGCVSAPKASQQKRETWRFCWLFGLYTLLCFLLLYVLEDRLVVPFTRFIAWLSHQALKTMGAHSWVAGASIGIPGFAVEIKNNCNAIYEIGLYASAIFAYPATLRQRTIGFLIGSAPCSTWSISSAS